MSAAAHPLTLTQVQEQLPPDLQLVEYAVLEDRLVLWLVTKTDRHVFEQQVSREALETLANDYLEAMTRPDAQSIVTEQALAAKLYDLLWARLQDWLNPSQEVVLVPDKFLFKVPFCALMSPANQHRLVEDYTILYSPSASVLIRCSDLAKAKGGDKAKESILTVGDPAFSLVKHPECQRLPSAITEAEVVGALYQEHLTLVDRQAQKSRVTAAMPRFDVIDIAGHYLAEPLSEERSRLLLAATTTGPDENYSQLSLREIQTSHFPRAKLATLSACQTGVERYYGGEGLIGLSRAFIEAGVPLVVGTQWAVESDSSARLIENLHRLRKIKNLTTTAALRQAQCEMLSGGDEIYRRPFYWAAFIPIGGHADY